MKISDLANLDVKDLQNIDYSALFKELKKKPDIIIELVCVIITIALCFYVYNNKKDEFKILSKTFTDLEQKSVIYDEILKGQETLKNLQAAVPEELSESQIIEIITSTAKKPHIKINSFSPVVKTSHTVNSMLTLTLEFKMASYENLLEFIYLLEQHPTLRIDTWHMSTKKPQETNRRRRIEAIKHVEKGDENLFVSSITLSVINFKHE